MQREEMAGENLREEIVEVAFEQWTEPGQQDLLSNADRI